jgi:hypothetical protein
MTYPPSSDVTVTTRDGAEYTFHVTESGNGPHRLFEATIELTEEQAAFEPFVGELVTLMAKKGWFPTFQCENLRFDPALTFQFRSPDAVG